MKKILSILLLFALVLTLASCSVSDNPASGNDGTYGLNEPAEFKDLKFTATEIAQSTGNTIFSPEEGKVFIGINFTIENTSSEEQALSSILLFDAYCDDVKLEYSISAASAFGGTLDGTLSAGKKMVGYYAVEVPTNWNTIELDVKANLLSSKSAKFTFNNSGVNSQPQGTEAVDTSSPETSTTTPAKNSYGLNEEATLTTLKITATEITESTGKDFFLPADGKVFVGVKFTIENISSSEQAISSIMNFGAYCGDVKLEYSFNAAVAFSESLDGSIAAGKKMIGYYAVEVPANWNTLEIEVKDDILSNNPVTFAFTK